MGVGKPVRVRRPSDAGLAAAAFVVPAGATALEEDDQVVRGLGELDPELVGTAIAAQRALRLELDPLAKGGSHEGRVGPLGTARREDQAPTQGIAHERTGFHGDEAITEHVSAEAKPAFPF